MSDPLPEAPDDVAAVAALVLDGEPSIVRVPSFAGNRVFGVARRDRTTFFKFGAAADIAREHAAIGIARAAGVAVPDVRAVDVDGTWSPHPLLVLDEVHGSPCDGTERWFDRGISGAMGRLHAVTLDGFGTTTATGAGQLRGENDTWSDALHARAEAARAAAELGLVEARLVDRVRDAIERHRPILSLEQGRFLHGDLHPRHVYASSGAITAIIDWGDATSGDPDYDLARILHARLLREGDRGAAALADEVLRTRGAPGRARRSRLLLHAAVFVCSSMGGEAAAGSPWPPWWPAQAAALAVLVASLDEVP